MNFNIVMGDFHILQSYLSYRLYCENNISYNYIEKIECKQWYEQMADRECYEKNYLTTVNQEKR